MRGARLGRGTRAGLTPRCRPITCNVRTFGQLFGEVVHQADEGGVVAYSGDVHRLTEVRGQLRVGDSIEEFRDTNVYLLTGAEFAAQVGVVLGLFEPVSDGGFVGFVGGRGCFAGELSIGVDELLGGVLREAEFFEDGRGFGDDSRVELDAIGGFEIFIFLRRAFSRLSICLWLGLLVEDGLAITGALGSSRLRL